MLRQTLLLLVGAGAQLCWGNPISAANAHSLWNGKGEMVPGKAFDRFITIWLENQDDDKVDRDPIIQKFKKQGILLAEYYGLTHPSQPNYIASVCGDYFGLNHDNLVTIPKNVSTVVDLLEDRLISWAGYFEDMPGPGFFGEGSTKSGKEPVGSRWYHTTSAEDDGGAEEKWSYVRKHNPFIGFESIATNGTRLLHLQDLEDFQRAVERDELPQYIHISPNMQNDGHDSGLAYSTKWLDGFLGKLLGNEKAMKRTLVLLTYDESQTYEKPNRIFSLLLGGAVPNNKRGEVESTVYNHYSILATLQANWGLENLGRYDVGANVFDLVAKQTGYANRVYDDKNFDNSLSYPGFLNEGLAGKAPQWKEIPNPNLKLVGAGRKGVASVVREQWKGERETPYDGSGTFDDGKKLLPEYGPQRANVVKIVD